ncbi:tRNA lysidine(34) synthetase TilS [Paludisphaera rhizosphaerae]|uniref:tRNA lysidine(34) synthetase TilS n=1 Tax=Paludisphaera rhizosphaerae TaxID=2711216 RepID=UPI0013EC9FA6|nr:tRNA lysidine(34) synthetase TilS [Paludisphaera rhizosphaerae]
MGSDPSHDHTGPPAWLEAVRRRIAGWLGEGLGPVWVVAVSGGGDSVGLLRTLHGLRNEFGLSLSVAHLNHGVRGESAREDALFVADLSGSLGLPFDLGSWAPTRTGHFEADARAARHAWLAGIAKERGAAAVAVGHTRDDQAETILHRIVRGTGPRGLAGIPARRPLAPGVTLVRPLLDVSRREIHDELTRLGQNFREDATNADVSHTRARIRHDLIPKLEADYNPQVAAALARLGGLAASEQRLLDSLLAPVIAGLVRKSSPSEIVFERRCEEWRNPLLAREIVRRAWQKAGWPERSMTAQRWRRLAEAVAAGVPAEHLGEGASLRVEADTLILDRSNRSRPLIDDWYALEAPGSITIPWAHGDLIAIDEQDEDFDEVVDRDQIHFPLTVRTALPGERFDPLGMDGRRQRVVEFLRLRHVPREHRATFPVVADRKGIIWVVGHRIAERVRTRETTRRRLGLRWLPHGPV